MDEIILNIQDKRLKLEFGLSLFRILGKKWNVPGINEVVARMGVLDGSVDNLSFEQLDVLEDILLAAIENGNNDVDLSTIKVIDEFFKNPKALEQLTSSIVSSLPQNKSSEGKPKVTKVTKKTNR
ncbi:hypothetical protein [Flavobacterium algicola]|uniref:hypothetical protein n=1 Tax=Flavobacterium algicola TaxID=556529 RepID=UPI001EFCE4E9|nr:hypothetical protein [Flavobacterium algicola]MCG9792481.1 hypothetical protein [Flavobacterium algicola]